jgi:hypothetical protein
MRPLTIPRDPYAGQNDLAIALSYSLILCGCKTSIWKRLAIYSGPKWYSGRNGVGESVGQASKHEQKRRGGAIESHRRQTGLLPGAVIRPLILSLRQQARPVIFRVAEPRAAIGSRQHGNRLPNGEDRAAAILQNALG